MKITKSKLQKLIKEELLKVLLQERGGAMPWTVPNNWVGVTRKDKKLLRALRQGKWGSEWMRSEGSSHVQSAGGRYYLRLMAMGDEIGISINDEEQLTGSAVLIQVRA